MIKKNKKQSVPEPGTQTQTPGLSIIPGITVIAMVMLVFFAAVFVLLWRFGMLPSYLGGIFSPSGGKTGLPESAYNEINLGGDADWNFSDENFYTPDFSDVAGDKEKIAEAIRSIAVYDCYRQNIVINYGMHASKNLTICCDGEKYRVESPKKLVVCDGETVYLRLEVNDSFQYEHTWSAASGHFTLKSETELPTVADILAEIEASDHIPDFSYDDVDKVMVLSDIGDETVTRSYGISCETGMVLFGLATKAGGEILYQWRTVFYDFDPEFSADMFTVPQKQNGE